MWAKKPLLKLLFNDNIYLITEEKYIQRKIRRINID